jgi:hypothetical protein
MCNYGSEFVTDLVHGWFCKMEIVGCEIERNICQTTGITRALLVSVVSDSLTLMRVLHGSLQPSESRFLLFRLKLLRAGDTIMEAYPGDIPDNDAYPIHYATLLGAVAGAIDFENEKNAPEDSARKFEEFSVG